MKQYNYNISSIDELFDILHSEEIASFYNCQSQLVQIFSAKNESEWYNLLGNTIHKVFPTAVIVGASTIGEINEGKLLTDSTVIMFSFFSEATLHLFTYECKNGNEEIIGEALSKDIKFLNLTVKGVLLLSTPLSNDSAKLFNSIIADNVNYPIFGGGAGDYSSMQNTLVFDGINCLEQGVVAVALCGNNLFIEPFTYLGWQPLSKEMTITETDNMIVKTIDGAPAFSVYEKYFGIKSDEDFFLNVLEFPFLIKRNGQVIARVPLFANKKDGSIQFVADIKEGEKFRIGYGNPKTITRESISIQNKMRNFQPDAIFLYTCICRRFFLQREVDNETAPLNLIAPTAGFYTCGEFFADSTNNALLNSTMVTVGIREGSKDEIEEGNVVQQSKKTKQNSDPYKNQYSKIISRLLYFINATINELEDQNQVLKSLNDQKNEFLGIAAHDLRNPIGVIHGFSELLEEKLHDENKTYAEIINNTSSTMLSLINDLLDISKIESGKLDLRIAEVDYIALIKQNVMMNEFIAQRKKIKIVCDFDVPNQTISIDSGKVGQVLNNLISNAIKYSYPDTTITVKVFREANQIITQIIDQGQGIPENEINGIFHPFKTTSARPTGNENSHGLGLAIVKKIIEGHNGQVGVNSEVGKGSVFYYSLPL